VPTSLEHASRVLGASPLRTYARVTLPLAGRGLISAVVTCWARAMSEFGATILFAGNFPGRTQTLPVSIFMAMQFDIDRAVTMAVITMVFSIAAFMLAQLGLRTAAP